jgi:hypothetical protein
MDCQPARPESFQVFFLIGVTILIVLELQVIGHHYV